MNEERLMQLDKAIKTERAQFERLLAILIASGIVTEEQLLLARRLVMEGAAVKS